MSVITKSNYSLYTFVWNREGAGEVSRGGEEGKGMMGQARGWRRGGEEEEKEGG